MSDPVSDAPVPDTESDRALAVDGGDGVTKSYNVPASGTAGFPTPGTTPPSAGDQELPSIPGYDLLGILGRGGMGVVYKAQDRNLKRPVALKMVLGGQYAGPRERERFRTEAESAARLQHPNIVQVFEVGEHDNRPYCALEYVSGGSLDAHLAGTPLPPRDAAILTEKLARAMQAAHDAGIVHRDLKPANVLLSFSGESKIRRDDRRIFDSPLNDAIPKITDFGLAKVLDEDSGQTQSGAILGTPSYMAPEQASGQTAAAGPAADIYALGAILYELLTGRPPFRAASLLETLEQVRTREPLPPSRLQPGTPRDLETICLKCLHKLPQRRYASAGALADDLHRWLHGEPIVARPVSRLERAAKWAKRRPAAAALVGLGVLLVFALGALLWWYNLRVQEQQALLLVEKLKTAEVAEVPRLIDDLKPYRRWADPLLRELADESPADSRERLHAALALLPVDEDQTAFLLERLLAASPDELPVIRNALRDQADAVKKPLWQVLENAGEDGERRLRAACALATYSRDDPRWQAVSRDVARRLVANPLLIGKWAVELRPARRVLTEPLAEMFRDPRGPAAERELASNLLADYAVDQPEILVDLLLVAEPAQFSRLFPVIRPHAAQAIPLLREVLKTPLPPVAKVEDREKLANRQAHAAIVLAQLGEPDAVWPLLRHDPDPSCRTYLTLGLGRLGTDPGIVISRLKTETDVAIRRALILSLGEYPAERVPAAASAEVVALLLRWFRDDPDPGIHSAIDWLLRRPGPMQCRSNDLDVIDCGRAGEPTGNRRWYVTCEGHTLAIVPKPEPFWMGAPAHEPSRRESSETPYHRKHIQRSFAIGTKEVSIVQFLRYVKDTSDGRREHKYEKHYSPDPAGAVIGVSWYEAAAYCNWLSKQEGIPEKDWCYPTKDIGDRMSLADDFLKRKGYRLPTEAEWEYACRAGAITSHFYGMSPAMLDEYAWYYKNSEDRAWRCGSLKPNDFGLFDVYGNVLEWCQDRQRAYPYSSMPDETFVDEPSPLDFMVPDSPLFRRVLRGGSFGSRPATLRSAARYSDRPGTRFDSVGLRVARTVD